MIRVKGTILFGATVTGALGITPGMVGTVNYTGYPGKLAVTIPAMDTIYPTPFFSGYATPVAELGSSIPMLTIEMEAIINELGELNITLPMVLNDFIGNDSVTGTLSVSLPKMRRELSGNAGATGILTASIPSLTRSISGEDSCLGTLDITLPVFTKEFTGATGETGSISISIPRLKSAFELAGGQTGALAVTLPAMVISLENAIGLTGTLAISIPSFTASISGYNNEMGTLDVTIPILSIKTFTYTLVDAEGNETDHTSMVVNLRNKAITQYSNYNFNSLCHFNGKNLGALPTGIKDLSGSTDDGTTIEWNFRTGYIDLEMKNKNRLKQAWLSYKTNGDLMATVILPDGETYEYDIEGYEETEGGCRVKFGKGIKSKYVALDIKNVDGSTLNLDAIRLHYDSFRTKR